jgi:elongation factor G
MPSAKHSKMSNPKILEPIYNLEVWVPSDRMGDVMSDLQGRRAMIMGMGSEREWKKSVPGCRKRKCSNINLAQFCYGGRGVFRISYSTYEKVPAEVQDELAESIRSRTGRRIANFYQIHFL